MNYYFVKLIAFLFLLTFFSSCAASHIGYVTSSTSLSSPNYNIIKKEITGKATTTYILGIGGINTDNLIEEAKKNMLTQNPLLENQSLANISVNFKKTNYLFLYGQTTCTITADVVEFK